MQRFDVLLHANEIVKILVTCLHNFLYIMHKRCKSWLKNRTLLSIKYMYLLRIMYNMYLRNIYYSQSVETDKSTHRIKNQIHPLVM